MFSSVGRAVTHYQNEATLTSVRTWMRGHSYWFEYCNVCWLTEMYANTRLILGTPVSCKVSRKYSTQKNLRNMLIS